MQILITGGAGYIGYALAQELAKENFVKKIILYDNLSRHNENIFFGKLSGHTKLQLVRADVLDSRKLKSQLAGTDIVYHLAAKVITPFAHQDPHFFEQINHWGTAELVYALENSTVSKVIYLSSASVYGRTTEAATETTPPNPQTYYGISKLRGEEHVRRLMGKMQTLILRCGNVYGYSRSMRFDAVINNFMLQANFENTITIQGSGAQTRAFIHIDDLCRVLVQTATTALPNGIYNCATKNLAVNDIAEIILQLYPGCERIFVNQHFALGGLQVKKESTLWKAIQLHERTLYEELKEFKEKFSF
jgi:UDP-glucose 4-epimerase